MGKRKLYSDADLQIAQSIADSPRGSMKKAANFLDCSPTTAKIKLLERQNEQLTGCQTQERQVVNLFEKPRKRA